MTSNRLETIKQRWPTGHDWRTRTSDVQRAVLSALAPDDVAYLVSEVERLREKLAPKTTNGDSKKEDFLQTLRRINGERNKAWALGQDMDPLYAAVEYGGEGGEVLNEVKKLVREQRGWVGSRTTVQKLADEIGDAIICLDTIARLYGINLAEAVTNKFNATSDKVGLEEFKMPPRT